jgi:hypothetical protein
MGQPRHWPVGWAAMGSSPPRRLAQRTPAGPSRPPAAIRLSIRVTLGLPGFSLIAWPRPRQKTLGVSWVPGRLGPAPHVAGAGSSS